MGSREKWMDQVGPSHVDWRISDQVSISPFVHPDDLSGSPIALSREKPWKIGAMIDGQSLEANPQAVEAALELRADIILTPCQDGRTDRRQCIYPDSKNSSRPDHAWLVASHVDPVGEVVAALHLIEEQLLHGQTNLMVILSIDDRFFVSLAKLRSLRITSDMLLAQYDGTCRCQIGARISDGLNSESFSLVPLTVRATAAACAADVLFVKYASAYEVLLQHILRVEGNLGQTMDAAAGSYFLETLTDTIGAKAWEQFKRDRV